jgi:hypothetical protein
MQAFSQMMWSVWQFRARARCADMVLGAWATASAHPFSIEHLFSSLLLAGPRLRRSTCRPHFLRGQLT